MLRAGRCVERTTCLLTALLVYAVTPEHVIASRSLIGWAWTVVNCKNYVTFIFVNVQVGFFLLAFDVYSLCVYIIVYNLVTKKDRWNFFCSDEQAFYSRHNMYMRCRFCMPLLGHIQLTKPNWNLFLLQTVCSFLLPSMRMFLCLEACFCLVVNCLWFVASFGVICIQRLYSQHTMCSSRLI